MEHFLLQSEAFHKDMDAAIRKINVKFQLNIKYGLVTLGDQSLVIQLDAEPKE